MFSQKANQVYFYPIAPPKNLLNLNYEKEEEYMLTWSFAILPNKNMFVIHNETAFLYEPPYQNPIKMNKVIKEPGYGYKIHVSDERVFLVSASNTIEVDSKTLEKKFVYKGLPIFLSNSEIAYFATHGPDGGSAYIVTSRNSDKKTKKRINNKDTDRALSLTKLSNDRFVLITTGMSQSQADEKDNQHEVAKIHLWEKTNNKWKKTEKISFLLAKGSHHILHPADKQILILTTGKTQTYVTPIDLEPLKVQKAWSFICGFMESYFVNINMPDKSSDSTFDARTILFYKKPYSRSVANLYCLDLSTHSLKKMNVKIATNNPQQICALSKGELLLGNSDQDARILSKKMNIDIIKIQKTITSNKAFELVSSSTNIFHQLIPIILDYTADDFPLSYPTPEIEQNLEEAKLHTLDEQREAEEAIRILKEHEKHLELREKARALEQQIAEIQEFKQVTDLMLDRFNSEVNVDEDEFVNFINQLTYIKNQYYPDKDEPLSALRIFVEKKYSEQGKNVFAIRSRCKP